MVISPSTLVHFTKPLPHVILVKYKVNCHFMTVASSEERNTFLLMES